MKIINEFLVRPLIFMVLTGSVFAATVDGIRIHSSISGKGPKTVMLVHGWTCDSTSWQSQVPELSKNSRVITLDLPGHGKSNSPKDGNLSMDLFARAIEAVRAEAIVDRMTLVGHSMGTAVIIQYAQMYPQRVAALVFVDGLYAAPQNLKAPALTSEQFSTPEGMKMREGIVRGMFSSLTTEEMQKQILTMMMGAPASTASGAMKAIMDPAIWKEAVIAKPVLGIYADHSSLTGNLENMKTRFPNLEYVEIPDTGHFLMIEKPQEFNRLLKSFLDKQKY